MSFQPVLPLDGYAGWRFLATSLAAQQSRLAADPSRARDIAYFRETIPNVRDAGALVADFRLLRVALGAFGLQDDLPNRAFIRTVLSQPVTDETALVNRLADKRYRAFAEAFGFGGPLAPRTVQPGFADRILARYERQEFERSVGQQSETLRLALTAQRELPELVARGLSDTTAWLSVMGNPPLRKVFETAFGLPAATGTLDLDLQLRNFRSGAERLLGDPDFVQFSDPDRIEALIRGFTIRAEAAAGPSPLTPGFAALTLLRGGA